MQLQVLLKFLQEELWFSFDFLYKLYAFDVEWEEKTDGLTLSYATGTNLNFLWQSSKHYKHVLSFEFHLRETVLKLASLHN